MPSSHGSDQGEPRQPVGTDTVDLEGASLPKDNLDNPVSEDAHHSEEEEKEDATLELGSYANFYTEDVTRAGAISQQANKEGVTWATVNPKWIEGYTADKHGDAWTKFKETEGTKALPQIRPATAFDVLYGADSIDFQEKRREAEASQPQSLQGKRSSKSKRKQRKPKSTHTADLDPNMQDQTEQGTGGEPTIPGA